MIVSYNGVSKLYKGDHGGQVFRFVGEAQLSFVPPADAEPLRVGDDEVLVLLRRRRRV